jgi:hypothetical protein
MNEATLPVPAESHLPLIPPKETLARAADAAIVLKHMIDRTGSSVRIGQSEHIKIEGWQTLASIYKVTAKTVSVEPCEIEGIKGAHAVVDLIDDYSGQAIGSGHGYCMRDEPNRKTQPWFQIASMAQTRGASRAFSNKFRWVTVMAGYAPTPAEEMEGAEITRPAPAAAPQSKLAEEIADFLGMMHNGDQAAMDTHLKELTKWKAKDSGEEKFLKFSDLPRIGQSKPDWLKRIHQKVIEAHQAQAKKSAN